MYTNIPKPNFQWEWIYLGHKDPIMWDVKGDIPSLQWGIPKPGPRMLFLAQCLMRDGVPETEGDGKSVFSTENQYYL